LPFFLGVLSLLAWYFLTIFFHSSELDITMAARARWSVESSAEGEYEVELGRSISMG
jgi:hypothetical protein